MRQNAHVATADPFAQLRLLDLQEADTHLGQIAYRRSALTELGRLTEVEQQLARVKKLVVAAETEVSDRQREVRKLENDIEQVRLRASKDSELLNGGSITNAKQLEELQHEVTSLQRRQGTLEDEELELLERLEDATRNLETLIADRARLDVELGDARADLERVERDLDNEQEAAQRQRDAVAKEIPADLLRAYEKIRADAGGIGAALLQHGRCGGCRLQITHIELERIKALPPHEVVRCDECRRIMVRTGESGL